jgi:hypothetical protein
MTSLSSNNANEEQKECSLTNSPSNLPNGVLHIDCRPLNIYVDNAPAFVIGRLWVKVVMDTLQISIDNTPMNKPPSKGS